MNNFLFNYYAQKIKNSIGQSITGVYASGQTIVLHIKDNSIFFKLDSPPALFYGNFELPKTIGVFASNLHKKISKLKIVDVRFEGLERVLYLYLIDKRLNIERFFYLIFEITGRTGNLILTGSNFDIIDCFRYIQSRNIVRSKRYTPPPKMLDITLDDKNTIKQSLKKQNMLGIDSFVKNFITTDNIDEFIDVVKKPYNRLYKYNFKNKTVVYPFYFDFGINSEPIDEQELFTSTFINQSYQTPSKKPGILKLLDKKIEKLNAKIERIQEQINKTQDADKWKLYADTLLEHLPIIKLKKITDSTIFLKPQSHNETLPIPINPEKTLQHNIDLYYKLYKKYKTAKKTLELLLAQTTEEIKNIESLKKQLLDNQISADDIKNLFKIEKNKTSKTIQMAMQSINYEHFRMLGFDVYIGKNAKGNEQILKIASKDDIWMHPKNIAGPHLIIKNPQRLQEIDNTLLAQCAQKIKEKMHAYDKIEVDYTFMKFVKKPKGFKKGRVTYSNFKTMVVN